MIIPGKHNKTFTLLQSIYIDTIFLESLPMLIKNLRNICATSYYSAIKRNEIELFVVRWMDLESVIQSEVSQKEKNKCRMLTHVYGI